MCNSPKCPRANARTCSTDSSTSFKRRRGFSRNSVPAAGENEVVIQVQSASLNPFDWKVRAGHMKDFFPRTFRATLEWDVSGTVEEACAAVTRFKRGDEVYTRLEAGGGYAECAVGGE